MEDRRDFVEYLGPDAASSALLRLDDPADLVRASSVSRKWRRFVIANGLCKKLCLRMCPEISNFTRVEVNSSQGTAEVGSSNDTEWECLEKEHRIYTYLSHRLVSPRGKTDCILESIGASSTDNYPDESIVNTLEPRDRVGERPSYWSSGGESDPEVPETLMYRLRSKLCVINEIKIHPFKAFFQFGHPIYSAKAVRFRMGHSKLTQETGKDLGNAISPVTADDNYAWTYVSPVFPMLHEDVLQSFKLPRPVICIGGIIQIELLGRVQTQQMDDLYYICIRHVRVVGLPLAPVLDVDLLKSSGNSVLKYNPNAQPGVLLEGALEDEMREPSSGQWNAGGNGHWTIGGGWILNALLGHVLVAEDSDSDEEDWIP